MAEKLKKSMMFSFGVGDLFFNLLAMMELFYFTAFLTDYAKFSLIIVSVVLYATNTGDIICSLAAGVILQKTSLKFGGKYRSWLVLGPPIVAPLVILMFSKIGGEYIAAAIIIIAFLASHLLWNVVFSATGALVGSLTQHPDERTILSSSRAQGGAVSALLFSVTGPIMITFFTTRLGGIIGFPISVAIFGILMILGYQYVYRITNVEEPSVNEAVKAENEGTGYTLKEILALVFKNPPLLLLIIADTFRNLFFFIISSFAFYYFGYVVKRPEFLSVFILVRGIATILGSFAATWIGVRIGKRNTYWTSLFLSALVLLSASMFEPNAWTLTVIFSLAIMSGNISSAMTTALFADTVVYGEWKTGKNVQAFTMSLLVLPIKLGLLIRSGVITIGLIIIGFVADTTPTTDVVNGINSIMIYTPAIAAALAVLIFYFGYRIEDKQVLKMQEEIGLNNRRELQTGIAN